MNQLPLSPVLQKFVLRYGEMASHWGLNKTEAQIHGLLFVSEKPLTAEEITTTLSVARSNVSNSLKELQQWGHVRTVHVMGDRREHYESVKDVWELFRIVIDEQKRREIDPVLRFLRTVQERMADDPKEASANREQMSELVEFFETMTLWYEQMRSLPLPAVKAFLKLGGKAVKLAGGKD
jgi:DNA-binding transcriptional regulator GbsR (MarR family)